MKSKWLIISNLILLFICTANEVSADYVKLNKKNYENNKNTKAVIIYGVNWGRQWGCGGLDNAQLQNITFSRIDQIANNQDDISLNIPSKLLSKDISQPYAIIINPGEYALTKFDIRIAKSKNQVEHLKWNDEGKTSGGTFKVNAGEIVYIGDFGLDCADKPVLWRYYIQKNDFDRYTFQFKKEYEFVSDKEVIYRLFETSYFGQ